MSAWRDPADAARYADGPPRQVPGFHDLHRMAALLLAEGAGPGGRVLILGAGGGLELRSFADARPDWSFVAVDPSAPMLDAARARMGADAARVTWHCGAIDGAPDDRCDAACCLLTLHFVAEGDRLPTLAALRARLRPGAPLVLAHHSIPGGPDERARWLCRLGAFTAAPGEATADAGRRAQAIGDRLPVLSPDRDEALLRQAGFSDIALFWAALTFRGWVARA